MTESKITSLKKPKRKTTFTLSRRNSQWDPPTLLDALLTSPLLTLLTYLHTLIQHFRSPPFTPSHPPIRLTCISDTHTNTISVEPGDVLIHAGDLTNQGTVAEIQAQIDWLASLPHKAKIVIAGNHDSYLDVRSRRAEDAGKKLDWKGIRYLENESLTVEFKAQGRKLEFWGGPEIPACGGKDFAFQYPRTSSPSQWESRIPPTTDILITHTPPLHHLDLSLGCASLLARLWTIRPKVHIFGHVHSGHGREVLYWDEAQAAMERLKGRGKVGLWGDLTDVRAWVDAVRVLVYGVRGVVWERVMQGGRGRGTLAVNAAVVYQSTTDVGRGAQVVDV
ncbi:Metallo-dependent phosphatase [Glarea lozoyensis ATCC 20868]|uniref:Metallo-dependent phosphatase n=1 Tax=Glarea lozoyensis (strain ATCC 20868 / MF5171) TaxID=1116229 RepID=S3CFZ7_GLAL2|nr:Metallo-dependent phosphatase [Glarea lozoyensis ATCC 20868]EPE24184.1 Metallo-dependent phosphatase [Glarea lozoyensis ATCC 20868]